MATRQPLKGFGFRPVGLGEFGDYTPRPSALSYRQSYRRFVEVLYAYRSTSLT
jgi:hypothetical protein